MNDIKITIKMNALNINDEIVASLDQGITIKAEAVKEYVDDDLNLTRKFVKNEKNLIKKIEDEYLKFVPTAVRIVFCGVKVQEDVLDDCDNK